jgi:hypothetical protein
VDQQSFPGSQGLLRVGTEFGHYNVSLPAWSQLRLSEGYVVERSDNEMLLWSLL